MPLCAGTAGPDRERRVPQSDFEVIRRVLCGETAAFEVLVRQAIRQRLDEFRKLPPEERQRMRDSCATGATYPRRNGSDSARSSGRANRRKAQETRPHGPSARYPDRRCETIRRDGPGRRIALVRLPC